MEKPPGDNPPFRPRIGGRGGQVAPQRAPHFCRSVLARAQLRMSRLAGSSPSLSRPRTRTQGVSDVPRPASSARRCVLKARLVRMNAYGLQAARLHLAYIERDGVERDGSPGQLYGESNHADRATLADELRGERHQFRFIVSPEDDVDLTRFTRDLMRQVEGDLGVRLRWGAVNHYNTDNPHAHLVVRGVDDDGRQVRIDPSYISHGMRWQAQHLLTRELGPRLAWEIERQVEREVHQERPTALDRQIAELAGPAGTIHVAGLALTTEPAVRARLVARLGVLEQLQLAERTSPSSWRLASDWQEGLRSLGARAEMIKRVHTALGSVGDPARYREFDPRTEQPPVVGIVRRKGLHDELLPDLYAVVETTRGQAFYVRLDAAGADAMAEGAIVRLSAERHAWAKRTDEVVAQVARENAGVYDAGAHLRALEQRGIEIRGEALAPEAVVAVNQRRLERLERFHLVTRLDGDRWRIPADLVEQLKDREVTHPVARVRVESLAPPLGPQVSLRGPSWLDQEEHAEPRAAYGLGAEVSAALRARAGWLGRHGIPVEPRAARIEALQTLELGDVGRRLAAERGFQYAERPAPGMRGRMTACGHASSGAPLVCVVDEANRRLTVALAPPDAGRLQGRMVAFGIGRDGRVALEADGLSRGG